MSAVRDEVDELKEKIKELDETIANLTSETNRLKAENKELRSKLPVEALSQVKPNHSPPKVYIVWLLVYPAFAPSGLWSCIDRFQGARIEYGSGGSLRHKFVTGVVRCLSYFRRRNYVVHRSRVAVSLSSPQRLSDIVRSSHRESDTRHICHCVTALVLLFFTAKVFTTTLFY